MWHLHKGFAFTFPPLSFGGVGVQEKKNAAFWRSFLSWRNSCDPWPETRVSLPLGCWVPPVILPAKQMLDSAKIKGWGFPSPTDEMCVSKKVAEKRRMCAPPPAQLGPAGTHASHVWSRGKVLWARLVRHRSGPAVWCDRCWGQVSRLHLFRRKSSVGQEGAALWLQSWVRLQLSWGQKTGGLWKVGLKEFLYLVPT